MKFLARHKIDFFISFKRRLHETKERGLTSLRAKHPNAVKRRARRHQMRKMLLSLDYIIETAGGFVIFLIFFIGENKVHYSLLYQRILFCVCTFIYGIPIPMAYLLNESRVREVIVNDGWIEGFKSIFYTASKIRELERQNYLNYKSSSKNSRKIDSFNRVLSKCSTEATVREDGTSKVTTVLVQNNSESQNL